MSADPFVHAELPGRGRALVATRDIRAGEEVLREAPAAFVASGGSSADDCHEILAQIMIASEQERFREPIAQLVCLRERFHATDSAMLRQVARTATPSNSQHETSSLPIDTYHGLTSPHTHLAQHDAMASHIQRLRQGRENVPAKRWAR